MDDLWKEGNEERGAGQAASRGVRLQMGALMFKHETGTRWYLAGWGTEDRQSRSLEQEGQKQWYSESLTYVFIQMPHILGALQGSHGRYSRVLEMNESHCLQGGVVWVGQSHGDGQEKGWTLLGTEELKSLEGVSRGWEETRGRELGRHLQGDLLGKPSRAPSTSSSFSFVQSPHLRLGDLCSFPLCLYFHCRTVISCLV